MQPSRMRALHSTYERPAHARADATRTQVHTAVKNCSQNASLLHNLCPPPPMTSPHTPHRRTDASAIPRMSVFLSVCIQASQRYVVLAGSGMLNSSSDVVLPTLKEGRSADTHCWQASERTRVGQQSSGARQGQAGGRGMRHNTMQHACTRGRVAARAADGGRAGGRAGAPAAGRLPPSPARRW